MAARKTFRALNVRGELKAHAAVTVRGVALYVPRILRARLAGVISGQPIFEAYVNTLGQVVTVQRASTGEYQFHTPSAFTFQRTFCRANSLDDGGDVADYLFQAFPDEGEGTICRLIALNNSGQPSDSFNASIEIDVYD